MIALGIDPGTRRLGWGVVSRSGSRLTHVAHGVVELPGEESIADRLVAIESQLSAVIDQFRPDVSSVESLFFHKDAQAAAKLGHARGVVLLCLARAGIPIAEYAPARIKRTIAGTGQADKKQVALMVRASLALTALPPADAADALAIAITHLRLGGLLRALRENAEGPAGERTRAVLEQLSKPRRRGGLPARALRLVRQKAT